MLPVSSVHLVLNAGSDPRTWCWCPVSAGFLCFTRLWECSGARRQWQLLSACRISYSLSLVLLSVNQSSDKERATAAAHTPGAKKKKKKKERDSAWLPVSPSSAPPLTTTLIPPFKTHSCLCLRGTAEMKGNMQCAAFDCELSGVIRGKFTGLVCVLNTLAYTQPAVFGGGRREAPRRVGRRLKYRSCEEE